MPSEVRHLNLALQGGARTARLPGACLDVIAGRWAHRIPGISGTSAGAMNAVALAHGFASAALKFPSMPNPATKRPRTRARGFAPSCGKGWARWAFLPPAWPTNPLLGLMSQFLSLPNQSAGHQPLAEYAAAAHHRSAAPLAATAMAGMPKIFVCATNVRTGQGRDFTAQRISTDAIMASACLPQVVQSGGGGR